MRRKLLYGSAFALLSLVSAGALAEIFSRLLLLPRPFQFENYLGPSDYFTSGKGQHVYDPLLGWVPRPDSSFEAYNGWVANHGPEGARSNGNGLVSGNAPEVLVVGDSYTYGYDVNDTETWPSVLEAGLGKPVVNGGVTGYGIDQIYLRARKLLEYYRPRMVILSFIEDDIRRAGYFIRHGAGKPYFSFAGDELVLQNVPVPVNEHLRELGWLRRTLGHSFVFHSIALKFFPDFWQSHSPADWRTVGDRSRTGEPGFKTFCRLMKAFHELPAHGARKIVVIQDWGLDTSKNGVGSARGCAEKNGLEVLDLFTPLRALKEESPARYHRFFLGHMTPEGNRWVGEQVLGYLRRSSWLSARR